MVSLVPPSPLGDLPCTCVPGRGVALLPSRSWYLGSMSLLSYSGRYSWGSSGCWMLPRRPPASMSPACARLPRPLRRSPCGAVVGSMSQMYDAGGGGMDGSPVVRGTVRGRAGTVSCSVSERKKWPRGRLWRRSLTILCKGVKLGRRACVCADIPPQCERNDQSDRSDDESALHGGLRADRTHSGKQRTVLDGISGCTHLRVLQTLMMVHGVSSGGRKEGSVGSA